jgi:hypothetical protein
MTMTEAQLLDAMLAIANGVGLAGQWFMAGTITQAEFEAEVLSAAVEQMMIEAVTVLGHG